MQYRTMQPCDYPEIIALSKRCEGVRFTESENASWHDAFLKRNPKMCFVGTEGGDISGFVYSGSDGRRATVYRLAVGPVYRLFSIVVEEGERGKGYGSEMIMNETAISKGPTLIRAGLALSPFYRMAGFKVEHVMAQISEQGAQPDACGAG